MPSPAPSVTPSPAATESAIGPAYSPNDPCTTMSAIVTRPTVQNSVCTVRSNHVEIEGGYQNTSFPNAGNTVVYPQSLIRVGTAIGLEFQVTPPQYARTSAGTGGAALSGNTDAGAALKYVVGSTPKLYYGVQAGWTAPTGSAAFSAGATQSIYAAQFGYNASPALGFFGGVQDQILAAGGVQYGSFVPGLGVSLSLSNSTGLFGEVSQFTHALGPATPTRTQYILGANHDFGQRLQIDAELGWSPTAVTGKYRYVGFGFGYYF